MESNVCSYHIGKQELDYRNCQVLQWLMNAYFKIIFSYYIEIDNLNTSPHG